MTAAPCPHPTYEEALEDALAIFRDTLLAAHARHVAALSAKPVRPPLMAHAQLAAAFGAEPAEPTSMAHVQLAAALSAAVFSAEPAEPTSMAHAQLAAAMGAEPEKSTSMPHVQHAAALSAEPAKPTSMAHVQHAAALSAEPAGPTSLAHAQHAAVLSAEPARATRAALRGTSKGTSKPTSSSTARPTEEPPSGTDTTDSTPQEPLGPQGPGPTLRPGETRPSGSTGLDANMTRTRSRASSRLSAFSAFMQRPGSNMQSQVESQTRILDMIDKINKMHVVTQHDRHQHMRLPTVFDGFMGSMIVLNSFSIGMSLDFHAQSGGWLVVDAFFALVFLLEAILKMRDFGVRLYFVGEERRWNIFEFVLVVLAIAEVPFSMLQVDADTVANSSLVFLLVRIVKVARIGRILRLARFPIFSDLVKMLNGAMGGIRTLFWSFILITVPVYMLALVLRQSLGAREDMDEDVDFFSTVPDCLFTVFRCTIAGECVTNEGRPLFVHVAKAYGWGYALLYSFSLVLIVVGLFNIIAAIYVDNTLTAAKYVERRQKQLRMLDQQVVASKLVELIEFTWRKTEELGKSRQTQLSCIDCASDVQITPALYEEMRQCEEFRNILSSLDISDEDQVDIFETLDINGNGLIDLEELVTGIAKMRGDARRSDVVGISLIARNIQDMLYKVREELQQIRSEGIRYRGTGPLTPAMTPRDGTDTTAMTPRHGPDTPAMTPRQNMALAKGHHTPLEFDLAI